MSKFMLKDVEGNEVSFPEVSGSNRKKANQDAKYFADTWLNSGLTPDGEEIPWTSVYEKISPKVKDLQSSTDFRTLLSKSTEMIIKEPIEPILAVTGLYTRVKALGLKTELIMGAIGAVEAGEATEGGGYPEVTFDIGGGVQVATIGKSGIQASFTDEALRYTTWDLMAMMLRMMGAAVARHTEWKAINQLRSLGQTLFDNARPTRSVFGVTTGRDMSGAANGTITMDDIMNAYTLQVQNGFTPDTLILPPQAFFMWARDPVLRHLFLQGASGGVYFATYNGNPGVLPNWSNGSLGGRGPSFGYNIMPGGNAAGEAATEQGAMSNRANSAPKVPGYLGLPLMIIVSPLIPYDTETKLFDMILCSSGMVGYHLIDEEQTSVEWRDEDREITKVKFKQRDSFAIAFDGAPIAVFRNLKNDVNWFHGNIQLTQSVSGTLTDIPVDEAVV